MLFPIRCFTCNKPIESLYEEFLAKTENRDDYGKVMTELNIKRFCCRRMFITHANTLEADLVRFARINEELDESKTQFLTEINMSCKVSCD